MELVTVERKLHGQDAGPVRERLVKRQEQLKYIIIDIFLFCRLIKILCLILTEFFLRLNLFVSHCVRVCERVVKSF